MFSENVSPYRGFTRTLEVEFHRLNGNPSYAPLFEADVVWMGIKKSQQAQPNDEEAIIGTPTIEESAEESTPEEDDEIDETDSGDDEEAVSDIVIEKNFEIHEQGEEEEENEPMDTEYVVQILTEDIVEEQITERG